MHFILGSSLDKVVEVVKLFHCQVLFILLQPPPLNWLTDDLFQKGDDREGETTGGGGRGLSRTDSLPCVQFSGRDVPLLHNDIIPVKLCNTVR